MTKLLVELMLTLLEPVSTTNNVEICAIKFQQLLTNVQSPMFKLVPALLLDMKLLLKHLTEIKRFMSRELTLINQSSTSDNLSLIHNVYQAIYKDHSERVKDSINQPSQLKMDVYHMEPTKKPNHIKKSKLIYLKMLYTLKIKLHMLKSHIIKNLLLKLKIKLSSTLI